ncbi:MULTISPECIES: glucose-6-phosphate dehydrogenase [Microbacterium]|uniref:glucose-6-phosphate dehydrogenase n=1 Tax=Microbacterium TaxID=33882 RepID=UPI0011EF7C25|nr:MULTISPECIES: glucose-6-phosphate dehydrogenase [Microbacterium]KAA0962779.1 glucose-6-phosphate dehydrogenase [Microbacterium sp. ANT_H45B]
MAAATTLVIFGAGGDLTSRLLLPALGQLLTREPSRAVRIVGADRADWTDADLETVVKKAFASMDAADAASRVDVTYVRTDITEADDLRALLEGCTGQVALYFAVPPSVAEASIGALTSEMLPEGAMLVMEKPFGTDEASARALNRTLTALVPEGQIYRVDHFLGRSTTLNLLGARFANRILEPLWSADSIASVDIVYDEALALEGRAGYYDAAGALVDMIQSHLLQVLAVLAMEEPATLDEVDFRAATSAVLRATTVWDDDPVASSRRARYTAGSVGGAQKPSYVDEPGVDADRRTETLAEATFEVRNARWAGTPFRLRSGKALGTPATEIVVRFRPVRHLPTGLTGSSDGAVLRFSLGPDRISLELNLNAADDPFELERAALSAELGEGALKAYAEVLSGVLDGDPLLAVRGDAAEECWRIVAPILDAWRRDEVPLDEYPAGSSGPADWPTPA